MKYPSITGCSHSLKAIWTLFDLPKKAALGLSCFSVTDLMRNIGDYVRGFEFVSG